MGLRGRQTQLDIKQWINFQVIALKLGGWYMMACGPKLAWLYKVLAKNGFYIFFVVCFFEAFWGAVIRLLLIYLLIYLYGDTGD